MGALKKNHSGTAPASGHSPRKPGTGVNLIGRVNTIVGAVVQEDWKGCFRLQYIKVCFRPLNTSYKFPGLWSFAGVLLVIRHVQKAQGWSGWDL